MDEQHGADPATVAKVSIVVAITGTQDLAHLACLDAATHPSARYRAVPRTLRQQKQAAADLIQEVRDVRDAQQDA